MKAFSVYQHLPGEPLLPRDEKEKDSNFWGEGKFNNYVKPFLKEPGTFIDMGCNAGLFLKMAEDMGYKAIGVDSDTEAVSKGLEWREKNNYNYKFHLSKMEDSIDKLPMSDYTVLANAHYYFYIKDWIDYLDKLKNKTRYCIIVTTEKQNSQPSLASADLNVVRGYFKDWSEVGFVDALPTASDPSPRKLWGLCFKSPNIEKSDFTLDCANHVQDRFYEELDGGMDYRRTRYYRILKGYRKNWTEEQLDKFIREKIKLYEDIKENGQLTPILVGGNRVLDGNHRYRMLQHLGKKLFIRRV